MKMLRRYTKLNMNIMISKIETTHSLGTKILGAPGIKEIKLI